MWLFIFLFIYVIYKGVNFDFSSATYMDTAIFCACIASVGGIYEIENESHMDEVSESILNNAISELDEKTSESHENVGIQNYY